MRTEHLLGDTPLDDHLCNWLWISLWGCLPRSHWVLEESSLCLIDIAEFQASYCPCAWHWFTSFIQSIQKCKGFFLLLLYLSALTDCFVDEQLVYGSSGVHVTAKLISRHFTQKAKLFNVVQLCAIHFCPTIFQFNPINCNSVNPVLSSRGQIQNLYNANLLIKEAEEPNRLYWTLSRHEAMVERRKDINVAKKTSSRTRLGKDGHLPWLAWGLSGRKKERPTNTGRLIQGCEKQY